MDVMVVIPEFDPPLEFWLPEVSPETTFEELWERCGSETESLADRVPRHFWHEGRMMLRQQTIADLGVPEGTPTVSLDLRQDLYRIQPPQYLHPDVGYRAQDPRTGETIAYVRIDAEAPVEEVIPLLLNVDEAERSHCFSFQDTKGRIIPRGQSLSSSGHNPGWRDERGGFPERATLHLVLRGSKVPVLLMLGVGVLGLVSGYGIGSLIVG